MLNKMNPVRNEVFNGMKMYINGRAGYCLGAIIILYTAFFSFLNFFKYTNYGYNGLDLGIIHQVFYNSSIGNFFASSIHSPSYLGDHFSPILFLLLPFYFIYKNPLTLLVLQNASLAISAWPIFLISKKSFSLLASFAIALAWLMNPTLENISMFEFSFLAFALPLFLFAFYFYLNERYIPFLICIFLFLLVREDVSFFVFMFAVFGLMEKRRMKWIIAPLLLAVAYFLLAMNIISWFGPAGGYKFYVYYSWLGQTPLEIIKNIFIHPLNLIAHFFSIANIEMILGFLMPFAFLPLLGWKYLIFALPVYLQIFFLESSPGVIVLKTHYGALFLPPLFLSFIYSIQKLKKIKESNEFGEIHYKSSILNKTNFIILFIKEPLGILILIVASLYSFFTLGPAMGTLYKDMATRDDVAISEKNALLARIPPEAAVASSYDSLPQLSSRKNVYSMNYFFIGQEQLSKNSYVLPSDTEYLIINSSDIISYELQYKNNPIYKDSFFRGDDRVRERIEKDNFGIVGIFDDIALFKKNYAQDIRLYNLYWQEPKISTVKRESLGEGLTFLGYNISLTTPPATTINEEGLGLPSEALAKEGVRVIPIELFWQANQNIEKNYFINLVLKKSDKIIYQKPYPMAYGIFPSSEWKKGEIIQTNYWFRIPSAVPSGEYDVSYEVFEIIDGAVFFDLDLSERNFITKKEVLGEPIKLGKIQF